MSSTDPFFCSVIIPTIGRATLHRAVLSVLDQTVPSTEFEVIVVNDSGRLLPPRAFPPAKQVRILHTQQRERCFARNTGAAIACGSHYCFLDDDDWLLPGAIAAFRELSRRAPRAVWLYGGVQVVDDSGLPIAEENSGLNGNCLAQVIGGAWVPIQSSCVSAEAFWKVGGYNPLIRGTEDLDLCRRLALVGDFANTAKPLACLSRGQSWRTSTDYGRAAEDNRISRDQVVDQPESFRRIRRSASGAYWWGRVVHVYGSLALWNLRRFALLTAMSRMFFGLAACLNAGLHVFSRGFWRALKDHHVPGSLHFLEKLFARDNCTDLDPGKGDE